MVGDMLNATIGKLGVMVAANSVTSSSWIEILTEAKIKIRMPLDDFANRLAETDSKGHLIDNRMIECL